MGTFSAVLTRHLGKRWKKNETVEEVPFPLQALGLGREEKIHSIVPNHSPVAFFQRIVGTGTP